MLTGDHARATPAGAAAGGAGGVRLLAQDPLRDDAAELEATRTRLGMHQQALRVLTATRGVREAVERPGEPRRIERQARLLVGRRR